MFLRFKYAGVLLCLSVFFISLTKQVLPSESIDSLIVPNENHGLLSNDSTIKISKEDIQSINYTTLYDILNNEGSFWGMGLGINGHFNSFFSYGELNSNPTVMFNGRALNTQFNDRYNLELFSPEFFENLELLKGSNSVILSPSPNSSSINIQEIIYNSKTPFTRLWYSQEGGSFIGVDGLFSQNFAKGWNFTFGFKKIDDNLSYDNMSTDLWNLRALIRYNIDSNSSISLSDNFTNNKIITNGGVNPEESTDIYSAISSNSYFGRIQDRNYRHDINLTYSGIFSNFKILNTSYLTTSEQVFELPESFYPDTLFDASYSQFVYGNRLDVEYDISKITLKSGASINQSSTGKWLVYNQNNNTQWNIYSKIEGLFSNSYSFSGGFNIGNKNGETFLGFGENISFKNKNLKLYFDHSFFTRNSDFYSSIEKESNNLFIFGLREFSGLELELYYRNTLNPIAYKLTDDIYFERAAIDDYSAIGGHIKINSDLIEKIFSQKDNLSIMLLSKFNYIMDNEELKNFYPLAFINANLNYKLIVNQSELNLGVKAGIMSSKSSPRFIPVTNIYSNINNSSNIQTTGLSFYTFMRLGNAVVKLDFENLLDAGYYYTSFYPERGQILKLSVAWSFFD